MGTKAERQAQRKLAKQLYMDGLTQAHISEKIGVSETSISAWKREEGWEDELHVKNSTKDASLKSFYSQLYDLTNVIEQREPGKRHASKDEAYVLATIRKNITELEAKDVTPRTIVNVSMGFIDFLASRDVKKAREVSKLFDAYIKSIVKIK